MRKKRIIQVLIAVVAVEIICITAIYICDSQADTVSEITVREVGPQTVLYTIYRGHYESIGPAINGLYKLADAKSISIAGPVSTGYLNNPLFQSPDHWLIEIRIPVCTDALELSGTLGQMTDVKILPPMKVAAAIKPEGQENPEIAIFRLYSWINKHGYRIVGTMRQSVLQDEKGGYSNMRTEFTIPVVSQSSAKG